MILVKKEKKTHTFFNSCSLPSQCILLKRIDILREYHIKELPPTAGHSQYTIKSVSEKENHNTKAT